MYAVLQYPSVTPRLFPPTMPPLVMPEGESMGATINTTSLAREYQLTTKDLEKRLRKLGVHPVSEVIMPSSGRRFILWPEREARKALDDYREALKARREAEFGRTPPQTTQRKSEQSEESIDALKAEVGDLKAMLSELLRKLNKDD